MRQFAGSSASAAHFRDCQPEGRGRQDHHRRQPRGVPRRAGKASAACGCGSTGQRDERAGCGQEKPLPEHLRLPHGRAAHGRGDCGNRGGEPVGRAGDGGSRGGRGGAGQRARPREPAQGVPGAGGVWLRLRPARQPPVARPADHQLSHRGGGGDYPYPVRVLRARGAEPTSEHARPGVAGAESGVGHIRGRLDDVRFPHPPVHRGGR